MGIRPIGEGEREMSRQYDEEEGEAAEEGERCPFETGAEFGGFLVGCEAFDVPAFCSFACVLGLRLRARDRFSRLESEDSGSESSDIAFGDVHLLASERFIGAK